MDTGTEGNLGAPYPIQTQDDEHNTKERILLEATLLFARHGYAAVSMKDLADQVGIRPPSLYNHFPGKQALWQAVVDHLVRLYRMYFDRLEAARKPGQLFEEVVNTMFVELKSVVNIFTHYGFSLISTEQFRDKSSGRVFLDVFLEDSIAYIAGRFEECIEQGRARPFDAWMIATQIMHSVLIGMNVRVHEHLGHRVPYDAGKMFAALEQHILDLGRPVPLT